MSKNRLFCCVSLLILFWLAPVAQLQADDRDLVRSFGQSAYVFVLLDTSGSMVSPPSGGSTPWRFDDPGSRAYLAKAAIYDVISRQKGNMKVGFGHFAQPNPNVGRKLLEYRLDPDTDTAGLTWYNRLAWPRMDTKIKFGEGSATLGSCQDGSGLTAVDDAPKLGWQGHDATTLHARDNGETFRVVLDALPGTGYSLGLELEVAMEVFDCSGLSLGKETVVFKPWYLTDQEGNPNESAGYMQGYSHGSPCNAGWETNQDPANNDSRSLVEYPTYPDPLARGAALDRGDVLPWDWRDQAGAGPGYELSNRDEFLARLAPNMYDPATESLDLSRIPDFKMGRYYEHTATGQLQIAPEYRDRPPFGFSNLTPLRGIMERLSDWYADWELLAAQDLGDDPFKCRPKYAILLTDGVETCESSPQTAALTLFNSHGIRTFAVGFGSGVTAGDLQAIADNGGTGQFDTIVDDYPRDCASFNYFDEVAGVQEDICPGPVIATTRETLTLALSNILNAFSGKESSFTSAAVPVGQLDSGGGVYLPSVQAIPSFSDWKGGLRKVIRPLEFDDEGQLDLPSCSSGNQEGCVAWDAGAEMLDQAPTREEIRDTDFADLRLGYGQNHRRVFWARTPVVEGTVPIEEVLLFEPQEGGSPDTDLVMYEFWDKLGIEFDVANQTTIDAAALAAKEVIVDTLGIRKGVDGNGVEQQWVLGDSFHSRPVLVGSPTRFDYMVAGDEPCWDASGNFDWSLKSYRCFVSKNEYRRRVVVVGSNDGQVHVFDAGRAKQSDDPDNPLPEFTLGTGREIFSFMPTEAMSQSFSRSVTNQHQWGVDGTGVVDDVFIDTHNSGYGGSDRPDLDSRDWRTVYLGSFRRGGAGYFALDLTYPDELSLQDPANHDAFIAPDLVSGNTQEYLPDCIRGGSSCGANAYPLVLWEWSDEDAGPSWSEPTIARVRAYRPGASPSDGAEQRDRATYVAVFGGGFDPENEELGRYLYMVDVETGKTLYKREMPFPIAAAPAVVDRDQDSFADTIYVGDVGGYLHKVELGNQITLNIDQDTGALVVPDGEWEPYPLFFTGDEEGKGRPIFHEPSVIWVASQGYYAIAVGTGDREDLWSSQDPEQGSFVMLLDSEHSASHVPSGGFTPQDLARFDSLSGQQPDVFGGVDARPGLPVGWVMDLQPSERVIAKSFSLAGILTFTSFIPDSAADGGVCSNTGVSNIYVLMPESGNGFDSSRFLQVEGFVSDPFSEIVSSGASGGGGSGGPPGPGGGQGGDDGLPDDPEDRERMLRIEEQLKERMSESCRFPNVKVNIKALSSETGAEWLARVPVCLQTSSWKQWS